jgi:hypothetical protein
VCGWVESGVKERLPLTELGDEKSRRELELRGKLERVLLSSSAFLVRFLGTLSAMGFGLITATVDGMVGQPLLVS